MGRGCEIIVNTTAISISFCHLILSYFLVKFCPPSETFYLVSDVLMIELKTSLSSLCGQQNIIVRPLVTPGVGESRLSQDMLHDMERLNARRKGNFEQIIAEGIPYFVNSRSDKT